MLAACGSKPPRQWIALPLPAAEPPASTSPTASMPGQGLAYDVTPVLVVRRLNVPEYMQTSSVRYRQSDSVLAEWPDVRWADRLEVGMTEHLVMRLRSRLPGWVVCDRQCPMAASAITLTVDLSPMDYVRSARELRTEARWTFVQRAHTPAVEARPGMLPGQRASAPPQEPLAANRSAHGLRTFRIQAGSDDAQGQAAATGGLLDALAGDLAREASAWSGP